MKARLPAALVFFALATAAGIAAEPQTFPEMSAASGLAPAQDPAFTIFNDFRTRLRTALARGDTSGIASLYETNGVTAGELKSDVDRWQRVTGKNSKSVSLFFKDLKRLPPESLKFWSAEAHRLTKHEVTHFALVRSGGGIALTVPLVLVGNRLLIVPSEKLMAKTTGPTGTFVYPNEDHPDVKLTLDFDGTYTAEDFSQPNYWVMMEGNKAYFEPLKRHPQKGHWAWDPETGELRLASDSSEGFLLNIERLRFESRDPDRLGWSKFAYFERVKPGTREDL